MPKTSSVRDPQDKLTRRRQVEWYVQQAIEAYDRDVIQPRYGKATLRRSFGRWLRHGFLAFVGMFSILWSFLTGGKEKATKQLEALEREAGTPEELL